MFFWDRVGKANGYRCSCLFGLGSLGPKEFFLLVLLLVLVLVQRYLWLCLCLSTWYLSGDWFVSSSQCFLCAFCIRRYIYMASRSRSRTVAGNSSPCF
ncbi:hypothetical protein P153DRAFT_38700 [Dothidotthia symphoricarpi CBS 119687]|uniref:Uncharacterized protein n=1 Tax=Dothidotthia symphoricarpi CBS 119687 TaxID=1392245 RepID=A0A6A6A9K0_9PLEO|nr:uncharacterized protein P153DRAFT_38700 [Dothidotthia symphoricarpi CBS 119687]KAF2128479.1 hypothetical protein P153DRAFT_38700 [Dothidotthia symphoricarpi CBS 119687]